MTVTTDGTPLAPEPEPAVEPWQQRLEVIAILLVLTTAVSVLGRLITAYDQAGLALVGSAAGESRDLLVVVRSAVMAVGPWAAAAVLVSFLLVTLGPGDQVTARGVLVLRSLVVLGLFVAGLVALGALIILSGYEQRSSSGVLQLVDGSSMFGGLASRIGWSAPLLVAAVTAGYVAWCAFSTLGEIAPAAVVIPSDAVVDTQEP
jgi:hypothetical protein